MQHSLEKRREAESAAAKKKLHKRAILSFRGSLNCERSGGVCVNWRQHCVQICRDSRMFPLHLWCSLQRRTFQISVFPYGFLYSWHTRRRASSFIQVMAHSRCCFFYLASWCAIHGGCAAVTSAA